MELVIKKFGGTSVSNTERIKRVARIVADSHEKSVVVVSAMSSFTNQLVSYTNDIGPVTSREGLAEYDAVISTGEQITIGLVSLALMSVGLKSRSYLGWQVPIKTTDDFSQAKILEIDTEKIMSDLENGLIPIIAGFQGVSNGRVTTLGRGGSDTTAVAVAAALKAKRCDIYTDVDGIFTSDPRVVPKARKINRIDYRSALEMASCGATVIHPRAVEIGMMAKVPIRILNTFSHDAGTDIVDEMEKTSINGIAVKSDLVMIIINKIRDIDLILKDLIEVGVVIDSVSQGNLSLEDGDIRYDYTITTNNEYTNRCVNVIGTDITTRSNINKISVIGLGVKGLLGEILSITGPVIALQVLETQVSFMIDQIHSDKIVRDLHTELMLGL